MISVAGKLGARRGSGMITTMDWLEPEVCLCVYSQYRGDEELPPGGVRSDAELPPGGFRGEEELPPGGFRAPAGR